ncbi:hypothetical protein BLA6860_02085 [Burkholderia lata]|uniref:hypothetical protein n=1 Tax=Burkholderia lata (strain ATCC 17760 / DSM 23089 / LMG 22485 / NCIMB 9086 / R18194 / 383) TaxID=482957 RepID=UPI0014537026|nr:hypothetical protein [Burkholderia lata]VWB46019.1 hypothetical protein BLA6860_02085 [Burkholderia lata]
MRISFSAATLARQPSTYALSDVGACSWCLLPSDMPPPASRTGHAHAFDARPIFRCRLIGRYTAGLSLSAVCGNGYAAVHQQAESHVDTVSRLLVRDAHGDAGHRVHAVNDGIDWQ